MKEEKKLSHSKMHLKENALNIELKQNKNESTENSMKQSTDKADSSCGSVLLKISIFCQKVANKLAGDAPEIRLDV